VTRLVFANGDPFSLFSAAGRELFVLALLVPIAVLVFWYGRREILRNRGEYALRPSGRWLPESSRTRDEAWRTAVERLESQPPTPVAEATPRWVRVAGTLTAASGNLGGPPGRECIWRNRAGARRDSAVGAEIVILTDDSGRVGLENIERAYVIAPSERHARHHENVSLYLGDRVEVFGEFHPEPPEESEGGDARARVYGTLGARGPLEVRLLERPAPPDQAEPPPAEATP